MVAYYLQLPYDNLEEGIELLSDIVLNSNVPDEEFLKEKEVVKQEESSSCDDVESYMYRQFAKNFYTNYLRNPIIGTQESIDRFTSDEVRDFYKMHCSKDKVVVAVSSNCTKKDATALMKKYFGKANGRVKKKLGYKNSNYKSLGETLELTRPSIEHTYVWLCFPGLLKSSKITPHLHVLERIIGGGMDSRLFREVREKRGLVYSIYATSVSFDTAGAFKICFSCKDENVNEVIGLIKKEIDLIQKNPLEKNELIKVKNVKRTAYYHQLEDGMSMSMSKIQNKVFDRLSVDEYEKILQETTEDDVISCAKNIFSNKPFTVICRGESAKDDDCE
tara:strand:- start:42 stop:1040 length:999 start_codon:yes stop_codon:yes gene_type:complete